MIPNTEELKVSGVPVYAGKHYDVWIVALPDMDFTTYAVINREHDVIEAVQPVLFNAKALANQFSRWLDDADSDRGLGRVGSDTPFN